VKPSLELWLQMAKDAEVSEQTAVLMWIRAKLPRKYQNYIALDAPAVKEPASRGKSPLSKAKDPEEARKIIVDDRAAPKGLKRLLKDDDLWALYKPQMHELEMLSNVFASLGDGSKSSFREALRLIREFDSE
jgi:hypothetical protein